MKIFCGHRTALTSTIILIALAVFLLHTGQGYAAKSGQSGEVRMAVDPTVLPPLPPPGALEEDVTALPADDGMKEADRAAEPDVEVTVVEPEAESTAPEAEVVVLEPEPKKPEPAKVAPTVAKKPKPAPAAKPTQLPASVVATPGKDAVTSVKVDSTDNEFILTVTATRPVGDTTYMNLSNPQRLVIDLREPWVLKTWNVIRIADGAVEKLVMGAHKDRLRVVVYFRTPPKGKFAPQFVRSGNKLIVSVAMP
ncbi:MAG: AMIN domain-containing protein [Pseudodesulfovibrio sp.]